MEPSIIVLALLGLFSATHIGLATRPVRTPLVAHLGERGFVLLFSARPARPPSSGTFVFTISDTVPPAISSWLARIPARSCRSWGTRTQG